jgi:hypothetical protein
VTLQSKIVTYTQPGVRAGIADSKGGLKAGVEILKPLLRNRRWCNVVMEKLSKLCAIVRSSRDGRSKSKGTGIHHYPSQTVDQSKTRLAGYSL